MKKLKLGLTSLLFTLHSAFAEISVDKPFEYGIFESNYQNFKPGDRIITTHKANIQETTQIPAILGTKFGVRYRLTGRTTSDKIQVKLLYLTPGIINPTTRQRQDKIEVIQELSPDAAYHLVAFEFTEDYEMVEGEWKMFVFLDDEKLLEQTFEVSKANR